MVFFALYFRGKNAEGETLILGCGHVFLVFPRWCSVKNPPANAGDTRDVGSIPRREDPLEEEMTARSNILAWRIPWTEEPCGLQSVGSQKSRTQLSN